jgi:hypothetical protein
MKITAVLTVRNEGAFLLEWLAHHRACGVTDFLVFSNDCDDGTDAMLDRLQAMGWLTHLPNPGPHEEGPQWAALKRADKHALVRKADWLLPLDVDEFLNIHVGDRTVAALLAALPQATAIPLTWRLFGNGGVVGYADAPVTETFTRAAPKVLHWPWRAMLFKTLYRNDGAYRKLGVHRPRSLDPTQVPRWFDGAGRELPALYHAGRIFSAVGQDHYGLAQINHYPLGAMESYLVKCDRGRAVHGGDRLGMDYWVERNFNDADDPSILALDSRKLRAELLADARLGKLHARAVEWRKTQFATLMSEEPWRALYGRLLMTPPTRALSQAEAETVWKPWNRAIPTTG